MQAIDPVVNVMTVKVCTNAILLDAIPASDNLAMGVCAHAILDTSSDAGIILVNFILIGTPDIILVDFIVYIDIVLPRSLILV